MKKLVTFKSLILVTSSIGVLQLASCAGEAAKPLGATAASAKQFAPVPPSDGKGFSLSGKPTAENGATSYADSQQPPSNTAKSSKTSEVPAASAERPANVPAASNPVIPFKNELSTAAGGTWQRNTDGQAYTYYGADKNPTQWQGNPSTNGNFEMWKNNETDSKAKFVATPDPKLGWNKYNAELKASNPTEAGSNYMPSGDSQQGVLRNSFKYDGTSKDKNSAFQYGYQQVETASSYGTGQFNPTGKPVVFSNAWNVGEALNGGHSDVKFFDAAGGLLKLPGTLKGQADSTVQGKGTPPVYETVGVFTSIWSQFK